MKEKIAKIGLDENIVSSVSKSLDKTMKFVENDILSDHLLITEVTKDLTHLLPKKKGKQIAVSQQILSSQRLRTIKELQERENELNNHLMKLKENEKLIEDEGYLNLNNKKMIVDENIRKKQIKDIKEKKENLISRIDDINLQINKLINEERNKNYFENKKATLKKFIENLERDKEIAEIRAKKYEEDQKKREEKKKKDIDEISEKIKAEINEKEKRENEEKRKKIEDFMQKQRKVVNQRIKDNNEKLTLLKVYINEKPSKAKGDYAYIKNERNFLTKEENIIMKEKARRKALKRSVQLEEIEMFKNKINEQIEELQEKNRQKRREAEEEWRNKIEIPDFHYPIIEEDINEEKKKEKEELNEKNAYNKEKLIEKIKTQPIRIDEKKQKERLEKIAALTESREERIKRNKDTLYDYKKKRILIKKRDTSNPSKENNGKKRITWELKLEPIDADIIEQQQKQLIKKPKPITMSSLFENKKNLVTSSVKRDYLEEQIKLRNQNKITQRSYSSAESKKWDRMLNNNKNSIIENVENVKYEVQKMENEAKQKERFLKLNGGIENFPELGEKVSSLLINSIKGKLSILNTVSN